MEWDVPNTEILAKSGLAVSRELQPLHSAALMVSPFTRISQESLTLSRSPDEPLLHPQNLSSLRAPCSASS